MEALPHPIKKRDYPACKRAFTQLFHHTPRYSLVLLAYYSYRNALRPLFMKEKGNNFTAKMWKRYHNYNRIIGWLSSSVGLLLNTTRERHAREFVCDTCVGIVNGIDFWDKVASPTHEFGQTYDKNGATALHSYRQDHFAYVAEELLCVWLLNAAPRFDLRFQSQQASALVWCVQFGQIPSVLDQCIQHICNEPLFLHRQRQGRKSKLLQAFQQPPPEHLESTDRIVSFRGRSNRRPQIIQIESNACQ